MSVPSSAKPERDEVKEGAPSSSPSASTDVDSSTATVNKDDNDDDNDGDNDAVDDTEDLSDEFADVQKTMSSERRRRQSKQPRGIQDLLPFLFSPLVRPLTISDLESCVALENAAFANPDHRCSREKFIYRLTTCPELCLGLFCTVVPSNTKGWEIETLHTAQPVETGRSDGAVSVLLAHIVATLSQDNLVTEEAMDYPREPAAAADDDDENRENWPRAGHVKDGRTACIHSLAVHPKLQGVGMGKLIVKAYMQQIKNSALADRVALICQDYLVNYYKRFGFVYMGPSEASVHGGGWHDMAFNLSLQS